MRILWLSNHPEAPTGYGTQTRQAVPRIAALGHDVDIVAFYGQEGWIGEWSHPDFPEHRHTVYPKQMHPYGCDAAAWWAEREGYDVIISLIDGWVLDGQQLSGAAHWAPWFPVDADPLPDRVLDQVRWADSPMTYSMHGQEAAVARGLAPMYVPHGVESSVYRPVDREQARAYLGLPQDAFVFGYAMANKGVPPRKGWDRHLEALAHVMRERDDVFAFLHTVVTPEMSGVPLVEWFAAYGIPEDRVRFADRRKFVSGLYSAEDVNLVYNGCDVIVNVANGEGFGLPIIEAQMAGTPVITGAWTSMTELTRSGWMVPPDEAFRVRIPSGAWQYEARPEAIAACMLAARDQAAADRLPVETIRGRVMDWDADRIQAENWQPALMVMEARLHAGRGEGPVQHPPVEVVT